VQFSFQASYVLTTLTSVHCIRTVVAMEQRVRIPMARISATVLAVIRVDFVMSIRTTACQVHATLHSVFSHSSLKVLRGSARQCQVPGVDLPYQ